MHWKQQNKPNVFITKHYQQMHRKCQRCEDTRLRTNYIGWEVAIQLAESINILNMSQTVVSARFYFKNNIH